MSFRKKVVSGVLWNAAGSWSTRVLNFAVLLVLARQLSPEAFGLVALANVFVSLSTLLANQGLTLALIQKKDLQEADTDTAFWSTMAAAVCLALALGGLAWPLGWVFGEPGLAPVLLALAGLLLLNPAEAIPTALLNRDLDFKSLNVRLVLSSVAGGAVGVGMALAGGGVWSLVGQQVVRTFVATATVWTLVKWRPRWRFEREAFVELMRFGLPAMGSNMLQFAKQQGDKFVVGLLLGSAALGVYTVAINAVLVLKQLLVGVVFSTSFPAFSRLQHDLPKLRAVFTTSTKLTSLLAFPVFACLAVVADDLLPVVFGEQWVAGVIVMEWACLAAMVQAIQPFNLSLLLAVGDASTKLKLEVLHTVVVLLAMVALAPWGVGGVALAVLVGEVVTYPVTLGVGARRIDLAWRPYLAQFLPVFAYAFVGILAVLLLQLRLAGLAAPSRLIMLITAGGVVVSTLLALFERTLIHQVLRSISNRRQD